MSTITYSGLPRPHKAEDVQATMGWWHGSGGRVYKNDQTLAGISDERPEGSPYYYIGSYVASKEGTPQSIGVARFPVADLTGVPQSAQIRRAYSGRSGDGTLSISGYKPARSSHMIGSMDVVNRQAHPGNNSTLIDSYIGTLEGHESREVPFLARCRFPEYRSHHHIMPGFTFANLQPKEVMTEQTARQLLMVAKQRAGVDASQPFANITDARIRAGIMSYFCTVYGNSVVYTMDAHRGEMSESFESPRWRQTGDCEDVSLDALMVFRDLMRLQTADAELMALKSFAKNYKAYMMLVSATSASAGGLDEGQLMAHMCVFFMPIEPNSEFPVALGEGTGYVAPVQQEGFYFPGFVQKGYDYTRDKMRPKSGDSYLGVFKRPLRHVPVGDKETVVSDFYVHALHGVPHDGGPMVHFLTPDNVCGVLVKDVIRNDTSKFKMQEIPNTGMVDLDANARIYFRDAGQANAPLKQVRILSDRINVPRGDKRFHEDVENSVGSDKINNDMPQGESHFKILFLFDTDSTMPDKRGRFLNMLKTDRDLFDSIRIDTQMVDNNTPGRPVGAWQLSIRFKSLNVIQRVQSLVF